MGCCVPRSMLCACNSSSRSLYLDTRRRHVPTHAPSYFGVHLGLLDNCCSKSLAHAAGIGPDTLVRIQRQQSYPLGIYIRPVERINIQQRTNTTGQLGTMQHCEWKSTYSTQLVKSHALIPGVKERRALETTYPRSRRASSVTQVAELRHHKRTYWAVRTSSSFFSINLTVGSVSMKSCLLSHTNLYCRAAASWFPVSATLCKARELVSCEDPTLVLPPEPAPCGS